MQASAASGPQGQLAGGQQAPGRRGSYPEAAASKSSVAGAKGTRWTRDSQTLRSSTTVPCSEYCMAAKLGWRGNPHCSAKGWGKEPTCVQAPAHHTSMRTLATEGDTAWGNELTAQPSASPHEWQRSKGPQVRQSSQPPGCGCMGRRWRPGPQGPATSDSVLERPLSARLVFVPIFGRHFRVHQFTSFDVGCFEKED